ncbi:MAG: hypothetical protein M1838_001621 [Thelocarpon superellum]|nr:MAG: hypothetical protein M1838_001621 [Thelocarpon superellum]
MFSLLLPRDDPTGGIERGPLTPDTTRTSLLVAMLSIAMYQALLVQIQVFGTFKRRNTLYFWSLLAASAGIMSHSFGIVLKWFVGACPWQVNTAFATFGWWFMVSGQSLVLYSRLHLVVRNPRVLQGVLAMIVINFIIFQIPTTIMTFGSTQLNPGEWLTVYNVYERIQLCIFTVQEGIISIIYIRAAVKMLRPSDPEDTHHTKKFLIYINMMCIIFDLAFVGEVMSGEWVYKTGTQSLAYGTKLTFEFVVLNKLMAMAKRGPSSGYNHGRSGTGTGGDDTEETGNTSKWSLAFKPTAWDRKRQSVSLPSHEPRSPTQQPTVTYQMSVRSERKPSTSKTWEAPWAETNVLTEEGAQPSVTNTVEATSRPSAEAPTAVLPVMSRHGV